MSNGIPNIQIDAKISISRLASIVTPVPTINIANIKTILTILKNFLLPIFFFVSITHPPREALAATKSML
jgi:hypothetical protein